MSKQLLVDTMPIKFSLSESDDGKLKVRGEFARGDRATANKRLYTTKLWEREIARLSEAMVNRRVVGELDHPADGRTALRRVSHVITNLKLEDGVVVGDCEPLSNHWGKELQALINDNIQLGVSSRGYGSTTENHKGEQVVQEDYRLVTFDFVAEPANATSYPTPYYEAKADDKEEDHMVLKGQKESPAVADLSKLKEEMGEEALKVFNEKQKEFNQSIEARMQELISTYMKDYLPQHENAEVDPDAEELVQQKDAEISELQDQIQEAADIIEALQEENEALSEVAQEAGYKYFLEQLLANDSESSLLRRMVGDVKQYESAEDIQLKVESCRADLEERHQVLEQAERKHERDLRVVAQDNEAMKAQLSKMEATLSKSTELNEQLMLSLYTEKRLKNHPQASEIRPIVEAANVGSKGDIDSIISEYGPQVRSPAALAEARANVRKFTHGGEGPSALEEEQDSVSTHRSGGGSGSYNGLEMSLADLRARSGLNN